MVPELVAAREVGEGTLIQTGTPLEVLLGLGQDCVPPRSQIIDIQHSGSLIALHRRTATHAIVSIGGRLCGRGSGVRSLVHLLLQSARG